MTVLCRRLEGRPRRPLCGRKKIAARRGWLGLPRLKAFLPLAPWKNSFTESEAFAMYSLCADSRTLPGSVLKQRCSDAR